MDRRQFISTVGAATAVAAASTALSEDAAHAQPSAGPVQLPPDQVDDRFLDTLTRVNDLQVPTTLSSYQQQIDIAGQPSRTGPERPAAGQRVRQPARRRTITARPCSAR